MPETIWEMIERQAAEILADQAARPRKWQDAWYVRRMTCQAEPPDEVRHIGRCYEDKNHEGPHVSSNYWHRFTWEALDRDKPR